uniref:Uncharacterized protein n=1 Tax=Mus musculus TaxID=10090 RepID=Q9D425_MOUSE|nr:unnamed protein product [Mus musculus]
MQEHLQSTSPVLRGSCKIAVLLQGQSCWTQGKRKKVLENRVPSVRARVNTVEAETLRGILTDMGSHSDWKEVTHVTSLSELLCMASVLPRKSPRLLSGVWLCWDRRRSCNSLYPLQ